MCSKETTEKRQEKERGKGFLRNKNKTDDMFGREQAVKSKKDERRGEPRSCSFPIST